jgi:hypothetical protein
MGLRLQHGEQPSGSASRRHCGPSGSLARIPLWTYRKRTGTANQIPGEQPDAASVARGPANRASPNGAQLHSDAI